MSVCFQSQWCLRGVHVEVRGRLAESVPLPPCQFQGSNPGRRAWLQAPVPAQPPPGQLLMSPSSSVPPRPMGHLPARCKPAREAQVRAVPGRHAHRAAPRTLRYPRGSPGSGRPSFLRVRRAAWRSDTGLPGPVGCAGNKSRARAGGRSGGRASERAIARSGQAAAAARLRAHRGAALAAPRQQSGQVGRRPG